jgi:excisionase family DNA binding protein
MATQKFYGEQAPRQIGQRNLKWGVAKFLTSPQVARTLQVSETTVLEWLRNGDMGGLVTGRRWYITPRQLEVFLEARANVPRS